MTNKKYLLKIGLVLGVLVLSFVALPSFHKANAIICDTCGGGGGGGGVTIPVAPTLNSVSAGSSGQVSVNFTDNSTNETGFYVYRGGALVATLAAIANSGTASVYTDTGMACGSTYSYNVSAYNSAGSASSASVSVAVKCPPTAPTINSYGATSDTAVSYTYTLTSTIDYLYLFRDSAIYASSPQNAGSGTIYTSTDSGLACGSTHTYFVRVGNGLNTADSAPFNITTNACSVAAPTLTSVTAASQTQLNVNFTNNDTKAFGQVGFYIYRDGSATALNSTGLAVNPSSAYTYNDTGVTCGSTHSYKIGAVFSGVWAYSGTISGTAVSCSVSAPSTVFPSVSLVAGTPSANSSWSGTYSGVRVYITQYGTSNYSLVGDTTGASMGFGGLKCPYPYTAQYVPYNIDASISGTDASCTTAYNNAGIAATPPTGARCAAATPVKINMSFCTQQFLGQ